MLKIVDSEGNLKFVLSDEDERPISIDDLILKGDKKEGDLDAENGSNRNTNSNHDEQ